MIRKCEIQIERTLLDAGNIVGIDERIHDPAIVRTIIRPSCIAAGSCRIERPCIKLALRCNHKPLGHTCELERFCPAGFCIGHVAIDLIRNTDHIVIEIATRNHVIPCLIFALHIREQHRSLTLEHLRIRTVCRPVSYTHLSYTYEGAVSPALDRVSVTFPQGWTGIIGDNGCGKSTLARVATGLIVPDEGSVAPKLFAAYCPQDTSIAPAELSDLATDWGSEALQIRDALGIEDAWLWDYERLSGGQKKRIQIACALWQRPDVLVLDEPTNDLDAQTRECVLQSLRPVSYTHLDVYKRQIIIW